ncbi:histamine H3 receptor-like [Diadema setosum]|uniref:histamine H3 receptor-like n=1 Tax=Diadema setosum TaxID=31175 RepID=UPI003B3BBDD3
MNLTNSISPFNGSNNSHYDLGYSKAWLTTVPLTLFLLSAITIIGNMFVIVAFSKDRRIRDKVPNIIILNLSITDLLIGLIVLPINTIALVLRRWPFGEFLCKAWLTLDYTLCSVSVVTIVLISLDRYWLVKKQLKYASYQTRRRVIVTIVSAWCVCLVYYVTLAFGWIRMSGKKSEVDYSMKCEMEYSFSIPMTLAMNLIEFIIPFTAILFLNISVYCSIRRGPRDIVHRRVPSAKGMQYVAISSLKSRTGTMTPPCKKPSRRLQQSSRSCDIPTIDSARHVESAGNNAKEESERSQDARQYIRHRKAASLLAVLVGAFMFCWLPYQFTSIRLAFCGDCVFDLTWEITNNLLWCNSTMNPFLYAFTNVRFGQHFRRFLYLGDRSCCTGTRIPQARRTDSEI